DEIHVLVHLRSYVGRKHAQRAPAPEPARITVLSAEGGTDCSPGRYISSKSSRGSQSKASAIRTSTWGLGVRRPRSIIDQYSREIRARCAAAFIVIPRALRRSRSFPRPSSCVGCVMGNPSM